MATPVERTKIILEALAGQNVTNAQMVKIVKYYINYDSAEGLSNDEIALRFIRNLKGDIKDRVRNAAASSWVRDNDSAIQLAVNASDEDLPEE